MQHLTKNWPPTASAGLTNLPKNDVAWQNLGVFYGNSGLFAEAVESFNQALAVRSASSLAEILGNLAAVYQKMGQLELAESCLLDALAEEPQNLIYQDQLVMLKNFY